MRKQFIVMVLAAATLCAITGTAVAQDQKPSGGAAAPAAGQQNGAAPAANPAAQTTPDEQKAFKALQSELDSARQMQMVDDFVKKYPNSIFLSDAYFFGAYAAQQGGDAKKILDYGNKSLVANANNLRSLLYMASILPQPQAMQGSDADKEKNLTDAETYANRALQLIPTTSLPNMTPDQLAQTKARIAAQAHSSLGMVHLQRSLMGLTGADPEELGKAETEYKAAISGNPQPAAEDYFRLGEVYDAEKKIDAAIDAYTQCSKIGQGTPIQSYSDQQLQKLKQLKSQSAAPAKP